MLYIRHAQKLYRNGRSSEYSLDPGLTEEGRQAAKLKFTALVQTYKLPSKIISSPYLRARETAIIAQDIILNLTGNFIEISYDPLLGEYLGPHHKHRNLNECLHAETLIHNPIPPETWDQYILRIAKYMETIQPDCWVNTWVVTHGLIIQSISSRSGMKISHPHELEGIYIDNGNITLIY